MFIEIPVVQYIPNIKNNKTEETVQNTILDVSKFKVYEGEGKKAFLQNLEYNDYEIETNVLYSDFKNVLQQWANLTNRNFVSFNDIVSF